MKAPKRKMIVIGLTGGIGSGKSEVARMLKELGAEVIDADRIGHEAYRPHTDVWETIIAEFGQDILQPSGEIDRARLGARVFSDPEALTRLNAIVHPRMYEMFEKRLEMLREQGAEAVVLDAALLIEAGWTSLVDEVWVTIAQEDVVVQRVQGRNGLPEEEIRRRVRSQLSSEERAKQATVVIDNNRGLEELRQQVQEAWGSRVKGRN